MLKEVTPAKLLRFVLPSILLMVFIAAYTAVDSIFIARFAGPKALAGLNLVLPLYSIAFACGIMFATGGGAIVAIKLGSGRRAEASENFSSLLIVGFLFGAVSAVFCIIFKNQIVSVLGAAGEIREQAGTYGLFMMLTFPFMIVKVILESILRVDGVPQKALWMTIAGGVLNIIFDLFFMSVLKMGIAGAGLGTLLGIVLSLPIGIAHFFGARAVLRIRPAAVDRSFILKTITNGSSEMVNEAAIAITTFVYNILALRYMGETGLTALAVVMGLNFLNTSVVFGFTTGISPLISYNYGKGESGELDKIIRYSFRFICLASALFFLVNFFASDLLAAFFLPAGSAAHALASRGLRLYSFCFLFTGLDLFGSAFFTAFGNGKVSALISFLKSFVFFAAAALLMPLILGSDGIWLIRPVVQLAALLPVFYYMRKYQDEYDYSLPLLQN